MTVAAFRDVSTMAFRNLSRHMVKTIITAIAVTISVGLYIFIDSWLRGINLDSRRNIVSYEIGAAKIQTAGYFAKKDELPMYESFSGWEGIAKSLADAGYDSAPRFVFTGTLYSRSGTAPIQFNAVDVQREARLLRYVPYLESGRFPQAGKREMAIGTLAAEKLHVGIPRRITRDTFENEIVAAATSNEDADFVRSLYGPPPPPKKQAFSNNDPAILAIEASKLALKEDATKEDLDRLWNILAASGRMDVRISTTIDMKAAPESVRKEKFEGELLPLLQGEAKKRVAAAYTADEITGDYRLTALDEKTVDEVLADMVAVDYSGAIRHVNQLIDTIVVGVINSPNPKTNGNTAFMPLDSLQDESGLMLEGKVTELLVRKIGADDSALPGPDESAAVIEAALAAHPDGGKLAPGLVVKPWSDYVADYLAASSQDNITNRIMIIMLFVLSFIGIANTMLMAILERTKETGMLRALGMTDGQVLLSYVIESGCIGALGSILGIIIGCLINIPMVKYGFDYGAMSQEMGGDFGYRIVALFRSTWNPLAIVLTGVFATLLSAAAAIFPTLRALKMPVTDSLRFE